MKSSTYHHAGTVLRRYGGGAHPGNGACINPIALVASLLLLLLFLPELQSPNTASAASWAISLPATFTGLSCSMPVTVTLQRDGIGFDRSVYRGREYVNESFHFTIDASRRRLVADGKPFYEIVNERTLQRLGTNGGPPDSKCDERLHRSPKIIEISGVLKLVTLFSDVWTAETLGESTITPEDASARFALDPQMHQIRGATACGNLVGSYAGEDTKLHFYHLSVNRARCSAHAMRLSKAFLAALEETVSFHLCCMTLELRNAKGQELGAFRTTRI